MALSKELQKQLTEFFLFKLWPTYPADLCKSTRNKGPKGEALDRFLKIKNISMEEAERILRNIEAQIRYDRREKSKGLDPARWPYLTTYLNKRRYDDELSDEGFERGGAVLELGECSTNGCEREVIGPRFKQCPECYAKEHDPYIDIRKGHLEDLGLLPMQGETKTDYYKRLRQWHRENLHSMNIGKS